eukprot:tig00000475_g1226.t1
MLGPRTTRRLAPPRALLRPQPARNRPRELTGQRGRRHWMLGGEEERAVAHIERAAAAAVRAHALPEARRLLGTLPSLPAHLRPAHADAKARPPPPPAPPPPPPPWDLMTLPSRRFPSGPARAQGAHAGAPRRESVQADDPARAARWRRARWTALRHWSSIEYLLGHPDRALELALASLAALGRPAPERHLTAVGTLRLVGRFLRLLRRDSTFAFLPKWVGEEEAGEAELEAHAAIEAHLLIGMIEARELGPSSPARSATFRARRKDDNPKDAILFAAQAAIGGTEIAHVDGRVAHPTVCRAIAWFGLFLRVAGAAGQADRMVARAAGLADRLASDVARAHGAAAITLLTPTRAASPLPSLTPSPTPPGPTRRYGVSPLHVEPALLASLNLAVAGQLDEAEERAAAVASYLDRCESNDNAAATAAALRALALLLAGRDDEAAGLLESCRMADERPSGVAAARGRGGDAGAAERLARLWRAGVRRTTHSTFWIVVTLLDFALWQEARARDLLEAAERAAEEAGGGRLRGLPSWPAALFACGGARGGPGRERRRPGTLSERAWAPGGSRRNSIGGGEARVAAAASAPISPGGIAYGVDPAAALEAARESLEEASRFLREAREFQADFRPLN